MYVTSTVPAAVRPVRSGVYTLASDGRHHGCHRSSSADVGTPAAATSGLSPCKVVSVELWLPLPESEKLHSRRVLNRQHGWMMPWRCLVIWSSSSPEQLNLTCLLFAWLAMRAS
jgi:hypothetical protein